ncbi:MAG: excalibur calcium-binding domain-containing protein [Pleurocapsa minor HA4230-MV1]|jgi:hypothetical protein|nr:excalibur calcium-binding domain-containing protein [Pleurocapsa minor HA4230-MV1]
MEKIIYSLLVSVLCLSTLPIEVQAKNKDCDDFNNQYEAQNHLRSNPSDTDILDSDNDGIACEHLENTSYGTLNKTIWQNLLSQNGARLKETKNKHSLTYYEAKVIIGFEPYSKNGKLVWEDKVNKKKIELHIHQDEITNLKGTGF